MILAQLWVTWIVILAWYPLRANKDRDTNSGRNIATDGRVKRTKRILGTPCEMDLRLSSMMEESGAVWE